MEQSLWGAVSAGVERLLTFWYNFTIPGAFLALVVALVATFVIFFDATRRQLKAVAWKAASVFGVVLTVPAVAALIVPSIAERLGTATVALAFTGLAGLVIALGSLLVYLLIGRQREQPAAVAGPTVAWSDATAAAMAPVFEPPAYSPPAMSAATVTPSAAAPVKTAAMPAQETKIMRRPPKELGMLVYRSGPRAGQNLTLLETTNLGRDAQRNEIVLDDPAASREHARIKLENGQFVLYDLASSGGTQVNGANIVRQPLANGDAIQIGDTQLAFVQVNGLQG
jgi:hypothetical protein